MNNFDKLLNAIKEHGGAAGLIEGRDCFDKISAHTQIPIEKLIHYLDTLQAVGLIKYSWQKDFVELR